MRRAWPLAFLVAFALFLCLRGRPQPQQPPTRTLPAVSLIATSPENADLVESLGTPTPQVAPEAALQAEEQASKGSAVLRGLLWALRNQNQDGSWGDVPTTVGDRTIGKAGVTGFVLLSLLGAGYSQLSKDEYEGIVVGPRVKQGLQWLLSQQREDGTLLAVQDPAFDQAMTTLALCEGYGMTVSAFLKEPAARALGALIRFQGADGSWGGREPTLWAVQALVSGESSELPFPSEIRDRVLGYLRSQAPSGQLEARIFLNDRSDPDAMEALAQSTLGSLPREGETDFESILHQGSGLYRYDGSDGPLWKKWSAAARDALVATQNPDGSWNGGTLSHRLVRTSLAELSLQLCYRYSNTFAFGR